MRVLVTGGAGYIGSTLVPMLLDEGYQVDVLDSFIYQENSLGGHMHHPNLNVVVGDIRDLSLVRRMLHSADVIIPLAAIVGAPACARDPYAATTVNHDAVLDMMGLLSPNQPIIMPTTNSAYGQGEAGHYCDESSPLKPLSKYAIDKVAVEQALMQHPAAMSIRLATVFGMSSRMRLDLLVNDFVHRALRDRFIVLFESHFHRNFIHVRDVSRLFIFALTNLDSMKGEIYNAGLSSANLTKRELCARIEAQIPEFVVMEAPLAKDPDQRDYIVSNAKIEGLGYRPEVSIDRGISELIMGIPTIRSLKHANA